MATKKDGKRELRLRAARLARQIEKHDKAAEAAVAVFDDALREAEAHHSELQDAASSAATKLRVKRESSRECEQALAQAREELLRAERNHDLCLAALEMELVNLSNASAEAFEANRAYEDYRDQIQTLRERRQRKKDSLESATVLGWRKELEKLERRLARDAEDKARREAMAQREQQEREDEQKKRARQRIGEAMHLNELGRNSYGILPALARKVLK